MDKNKRIIITGAAGSLGQNVIMLLRESGYNNLLAIDNNHDNIAILRTLNPGLEIIETDLADSGEWQNAFKEGDVLFHFQARITGLTLKALERDNVSSTENCIAAAKKYGIKYIVHTSSSVVLANANDFYTVTKKKQEEIIKTCDIPHCILRPTLMFGWFDKEHFGWLFRFMQKCPVFPIPGDGKFLRQPLYYRDMASCCIAAFEKNILGTYNITGCEEITYIDIMREIKRIRKLKTIIVCIPYGLFKFLLDFYALFSRNPPFTSQQLAALAAGDKFELEEWWDIFGVTPTPLEEALVTTFKRGGNAEIELKK